MSTVQEIDSKVSKSSNSDEKSSGYSDSEHNSGKNTQNGVQKGQKNVLGSKNNFIGAQNSIQNQHSASKHTSNISQAQYLNPTSSSHNVSLNSQESISDSISNDEVRTLFVSGLPMDVKQRELYLLFRTFEGYQGNIIRMTSKAGKPPAPVGFVTFGSRKEADQARIKLQGVKFDPFDQMPLRLEFARSNTKARLRPSSPNGFQMGGIGFGLQNGQIGSQIGGQVGVNGQIGGQMSGQIGINNGYNVVPTVLPAHAIIGRQIGDYFGAQLVAQAQANAQIQNNEENSPTTSTGSED